MKKLCIFLALLICLLPLAGCKAKNAYSETYFFMDTVIGVTLYARDASAADAAFDACRTILSNLEGLWSRHTDTSEIARFNRSEQGIEAIDARTFALLQTAYAVFEATDGAFDPTVAPVIDLWELAEARGSLPTDTELLAALSHVGMQGLDLREDSIRKTDPSLSLDLGGIGKGAAISELIGYLSLCEGLDGGLVSFGSNVAVFGSKPSGEVFRIALRDPTDANGTVGVLTLTSGQVLSVSGDYERYVTVNGEQYHHILDPESGFPAETGLSSVAVIALDGALADALSTALFVMGRDAALAFYRSKAFRFEAILIDENGTVTLTDGLDGIFLEH